MDTTRTQVVLFCRVSTDEQSTRRQIQELQSFCKNQNWEVVKIFSNKISGAKKIKDRTDIQEMICFVKANHIDKIVVLELSRLGRTIEAINIVNELTELKISLYIKNYGIETLTEDGKPNPIVSLLIVLLLEFANVERNLIKERMTSGRKQYIQHCRQEGIKMGRPCDSMKTEQQYRDQYRKEISLLKKGISLRNVREITGRSINLLRKLKAIALR